MSSNKILDHLMLFSIAIPAYKSKFLKQCIDSILSQTYQDFELIIVNDCSPEPIDAIVNEFSDPRISYSKNEVNIGAKDLVINWNNCLEKAKGDYFVMMGDDDRMEPAYLEEFLKLIQKYPQVDVYHCRSKIINEDTVTTGLTPSWPEFESVYDNIWHRINGFRLQYVSDFVYKTDVLKKNGGYYYSPLAWASDEITAYIASIPNGIAHTNQTIFKYRETSITISSSGNHELKMVAALRQYNWLVEFLKQTPLNEDDKVIHQNLCKLITPKFRQKQIHVLKTSIDSSFLFHLLLWYRNRKKYDLSTLQIAKCGLYVLKKKLLK